MSARSAATVGAMSMMLALCMIGCGGADTSAEGDESMDAKGAPVGALKPVQRGTLDRQNAPNTSDWSKIDAFVVNVRWADLQPTNGGPIVANNAIDKAIAWVRALPAKYPMTIKLRVTAGDDAPDWAKHLGGAPYTITNDQGSGIKAGTVGRFWTPAFGAAYAALQQKLAAKYDGVPEIVMTSITRCTTIFEEPFIRELSSAQNRANYLAAGYTDTADVQCQQEQIDAHKVWTSTRSGLPFNPYQRLKANGSYSTDEAFTEQMMVYCRTSLGSRCVLGNHSIRSTSAANAASSDPYDRMYAKIASLGPPIYLQTATPAKIGSWEATLAFAVSVGANAVELNLAYPTYDPTKLAGWRAKLKANPVGP